MSTAVPAIVSCGPRRTALVAGMVSLTLMLAACADRVDLQTGMNDTEANEVVAALRSDGIAARKRSTKDGVSVSVGESDLPRSSAILDVRGLPRHRTARLGEVFKKEGLISSPVEERARLIYALSQELEFTLGRIDGVVLARVHVVLPEKPAPGEPLSPSSAAVFIKHRPGLDPDLIQHSVRRLVARSIPGIGKSGIENVSLVFVEAPPDPPKVVEITSPESVAAWIAGVLALLGGLSAAAWWQRERLRAMLRRPAPPSPSLTS